MKEILLTKGNSSLVDNKDYKFLNQYSWYFDHGYARTRVDNRLTYLHRLLMNPPNNSEVDHINGNKLDNRRSNLRICNRSENSQNRKKLNKTSKFSGVKLWKCSSRYNRKVYEYFYWRAQITFKGINYELGLFKTEIEAARAYNVKAKELYGKFARLNL